MNKIISILLFIIIFSCENKREALGADNEIRVICSRLDREIITAYLSSIFIDTLYAPEPEPYYNLKFSDPETFSQLKSQSQVIVGALKRDNNSGHQLVKKLLPENQFESTLNGDPIILGEDVYAKKQLFMIINANSKEHLMDHVEEKRKQFPCPSAGRRISLVSATVRS